MAFGVISRAETIVRLPQKESSVRFSLFGDIIGGKEACSTHTEVILQAVVILEYWCEDQQSLTLGSPRNLPQSIIYQVQPY